MTINLLDRRNRDTDLAALTSRHNANLPPSPQLLSPLFLHLSKFLAFRVIVLNKWALDNEKRNDLLFPFSR